MNNNDLLNYVYDLGVLLKEKALNAKYQNKNLNDDSLREYNLGYLMAFHEVISLMKDQAIIFGIEDSKIGLEGFNPDNDLL